MLCMWSRLRNTLLSQRKKQSRQNNRAPSFMPPFSPLLFFTICCPLQCHPGRWRLQLCQREAHHPRRNRACGHQVQQLPHRAPLHHPAVKTLLGCAGRNNVPNTVRQGHMLAALLSVSKCLLTLKVWKSIEAALAETFCYAFQA